MEHNGNPGFDNINFAFPVKFNWWEKADLNLIEEGCKQLSRSSIATGTYAMPYSAEMVIPANSILVFARDSGD
jgi:hypothetical protein